MTEHSLRLVVRTPEGVVFEDDLISLRVPGSTGQVGLRPRSEAAALVVEPGLALAASATGPRFVATAGGLLHCDGRQAVLLTPIAVVGTSAESVRAELTEVLGKSGPSLGLRAVLQRLESGILQELRRTTSGPAHGVGHG